jgi:hypothetical protein
VAEKTMSLVVEEFTGQMRFKAPRVPRDATVAEFIGSVASRLRLPLNDSEGRPVTYAARARGGNLGEADRVGDVLQENEVVTLT